MTRILSTCRTPDKMKKIALICISVLFKVVSSKGEGHHPFRTHPWAPFPQTPPSDQEVVDADCCTYKVKLTISTTGIKPQHGNFELSSYGFELKLGSQEVTALIHCQVSVWWVFNQKQFLFFLSKLDFQHGKKKLKFCPKITELLATQHEVAIYQPQASTFVVVLHCKTTV